MSTPIYLDGFDLLPYKYALRLALPNHLRTVPKERIAMDRVPDLPGPCQLCGNKNLEKFAIPGSTTLWQCEPCKLYQYGQIAKHESYEQEYHSGYEKHRDKKIRTAMVRLNRVANLVETNKPKLLDIGCSIGCTLEAARQRDWAATGVDVSQDAVEFCRKQGLNAEIVGPVELPFENETFDIAVSWHVIEHVQDVRETLREWRRVLKPNGVLLMETPDATCPKVQRLKEKYRKFWAPEHTYTFSPVSLAMFMHRVGFELTDIPLIGPTKKLGFRNAAYAVSYQSYQQLRSVAGVNKAFQVCGKRRGFESDEMIQLPRAA